MNNIKHKFPEMLKELRQAAGFTQESLASQINKCKSTICVWETGRKTPEFDALLKLRGALGCTLDKLVFGKRKRKCSN